MKTYMFFCLWQGTVEEWCDRGRRGGEQSRQRRAFPVLSSQSGFLCGPDVWDAGPHVLLLQHPWWVGQKTDLVYSEVIIFVFVDVICVSFFPSLCHYCYILPGICLCTVQLSRCSDGTNWLCFWEVWSSLFQKKIIYTHAYSTSVG